MRQSEIKMRHLRRNTLISICGYVGDLSVMGVRVDVDLSVMGVRVGVFKRYGR